MGQCGEPIWFRIAMPDHLSQQQIERYRERQVPPEELLQVDDHLSRCPACRAQLASSFDMRAASGGATSPRLAGSREDSAFPRASLRPGHVTYEQLEAFIDGKATDAENEALRAHVDSCRVCAGELRDMSDFKAELTVSWKKHPKAKEKWWVGLGALRLTPSRIALALVVSAAIVLAVAVERKSLSLAPPRKTASVENAPTNAPSLNHARNERLTANLSSFEAAIDGLPPEERASALFAYSHQIIAAPEVLARLRGRQQTLLGESQPGRRFEVLAPLGELVSDTRPIFRWQSLTGATGYAVAIFDADLNPVQSSPTLLATQWTPNRPLKRGQVYQWQVTATLSDGNSLTSPSPPSPEAKFQVLDQEKADQLAQFQRAHAESYVALGILYAQAGLLEQGQHELQQVPRNDPDHDLAQNLLKSIREIRHLRR
jgi:anti-sigma factor RsiW